jgi:hypothetical protein
MSPHLMAWLAGIWNGWWWLIILIAVNIPAWVSERLAVHHKRRVKLARAKARAAAESRASLEAFTHDPRPGPCVHRQVTPVIDHDDTVVAWLCRSCDTQLPATWAVRKNDL